MSASEYESAQLVTVNERLLLIRDRLQQACDNGYLHEVASAARVDAQALFDWLHNWQCMPGEQVLCDIETALASYSRSL